MEVFNTPTPCPHCGEGSKQALNESVNETLHNAVVNSFEDFVEPFEVSSDSPYIAVNVYDNLFKAAKVLKEDALYNQYDHEVSLEVWKKFNDAIAAFEGKSELRPTRKEARILLADAFESVDPDHNWSHIRSDRKADETNCVKALLDAISGESDD